MIQNPTEIKNKIINFLKIRGPSVPVQIAKEIQLETLFTSAFLSELAAEKLIKISNLKVGGSPLYFIVGQEPQLDPFYTYLPGKEKEAFQLLKQNSILEDTQQEPAIRVALRNIKDFAFPFVTNKDDVKKLFWRFLTISEQEANSLATKSVINEKQKIEAKKEEILAEIEKPKIEIERQELLPERKEVKPKIKIKELPILELKPIEKKTKEKTKSEFVKNIILFLESNNLEILEEKSFKKREYESIIRIDSDLGKINFFLLAKEKKKVTENDLTIALQKAQSIKMPAFLISSGELDKKAKEYLEKYNSLIRFQKI